MATDPAHRGVSIDRVAAGRFAARNDRGGRIAIGTGGDADFTPSELLLAALGGCTAIDVDILTSRRAEPEAF
jgi:putative redox protein